MAAVRSLGLHEPTAIAFLVAENLLPPDPSADLYTWKTSVDQSSEGAFEDEIVYTRSCVVWSREGIVKRVFRLDLEKEDIRHALFTYFAESKSRETGNDPRRDASKEPWPDTARETSGRSNGPIFYGHTNSSQNGEKLSRALVVVLRSQAHIFFLSGNSHAIPLPFEVESVFATPRGLLFQRRVLEDDSQSYPMAPPNSFLSSSIPLYPDSRAQRFQPPIPNAKRPSSTHSPAYGGALWASKRKGESNSLPRVFSLMDPQHEMGLVVVSQPSRWLKGSGGTRSSGFESLDAADEIIYVSAKDELAKCSHTLGSSPLIFVVTLNSRTGLYTVWTARCRDEETGRSIRKKRKTGTDSARTKRRSSHFGLATGATTPAARLSAARESFGPRADNWGVSSFSQSQTFNEVRGDEEEDLASRIGQDLGDIGVPSKASRRVSSLLARADLASGPDRITFSDLATGNQSGSAAHGGARQSMGGVSTRASFGFSLRASLPPGTTAPHSTTTSFADPPVDRLLQDLNHEKLFEGFENMDLKGSPSSLPEEILLTKVESFSSKFSGNFQTTASSSSSRRLKVSTLCNHGCVTESSREVSAGLAVCIVDKDTHSMTVVNLKAETDSAAKPELPHHPRGKKPVRKAKQSLLIRATGIQHVPNVRDAVEIVDGEVSRLLTLSVTEKGSREFSLQSPWSGAMKLELPPNLLLYEPHGLGSALSAIRPREGSVNRIMAGPSLAFTGLERASVRGIFDVIDSQHRRHRFQIRMEPRNALVRQALKVCKFALQDSGRASDGLLVGWWEVMKWLSDREKLKHDTEWTAFVVIIFAMAVPFIENAPSKAPVRQTRRKKGILRSSSGSYVDSDSWETMLDQQSGPAGVATPWLMNTSWGWVLEQDVENASSSQLGRKTSRPDLFDGQWSTYRKNPFLLQCATLAREFLDDSHGSTASGPDGYLPTATAQDPTVRRTALCTVLVGLHLLREEQKLDSYEAEGSYRRLGLLVPVLAQVGRWLGWKSWTWADEGYYATEIASMDRWLFEDTQISGLDVPPEPFLPPSIFSFLDTAMARPSSSLFTLLDLVAGTDRASKSGRLMQEYAALTPRTFALTNFLSEVHNHSSCLDRLKLMQAWGLFEKDVETFPEGVSVPLNETVMHAQLMASTSWSAALLQLIDRDDVSMSMKTKASMPSAALPPPALSHDAVRDIHHIGVSALDFDMSTAFEASAEADRLSITRLIFREDKRFIEATRLLNQSKPPVVECVPEPDWSDSDLLEAQKELVQLVSFRTLSIPTGRAMLSFSGRSPLLTEKLPIPSFSLQCVMKPSNVTVSAERAAFSEEKVCWAFFHNGVSSGLAISRACRGIDTSWILFNKPAELTNRHAGFLLALGLNGHLKSLAKWVAFKYLTPKHTMTSIGLLLGLSASYLGTMDTLITRLLSVHVTRMLPMGAAELNLSPLTQTAGIMGIGLLYYNSQHRRMTEVMLSEIENVEHEEAPAPQQDLRDEGYRLAAGFALGLINLAKGKDLRGMRDMHILERLLAIAVGTKHVDLAHILDRATAGATVALMLIFMKTNDKTVAEKIDIPDTTVRFDHVRPDMFLLRTLAKHLILWDSIRATEEWFVQNLPEHYRRQHRLTHIRRLRSDDMPFLNIVAGLCFSLGLRFAGSGEIRARDLLLAYLDQFMRICRLPTFNYDRRLAQNSARNCQDIVALSAAAVMAGSGDLLLFRRLRSLHGTFDADTPFGSHMAAHMGIGMIFLGGGSYTLGTSDLAIAALVCSLYPIFPTSVLDNKCHLQALRHFWVLAAEPRCLVSRDIDTRRAISTSITITMKDGTVRKATTPCLLPDLGTLAKVETHSPDHWPLVLDFIHNDQLRDKFRTGDQSIYLRRKTTSDTTSGASVFVSTFSGLSETQNVLSTSAALSASRGTQQHPLISSRSVLPSQNIWDWIFHLRALQGLLDLRDKSLILAPSVGTRSRRQDDDRDSPVSAPWLRTSAVDSKLVLNNTVQNVIAGVDGSGAGADPDSVRDRIWQLRLLFSWFDQQSRQAEDEHEHEHEHEPEPGTEAKVDDDEGGWKLARARGLFLRRDFVEDARWKIWGVQSGDDVVGGTREAS